MFTLSTWRTLAGIASGFRRVPTGTEYPSDWTDYEDDSFIDNYGKMEAGDIIGPWVYVDLQNAFKTLKWTTIESGATATGGRRKITSSWFDNIASDWGDESWGNFSGYLHWILAYSNGLSPATYDSIRDYGYAVVNVATTDIQCSADLYFKPHTFDGSKPGDSTYWDFDGKGWVQNVMNFIETIATGSTETKAQVTVLQNETEQAPCSIKLPSAGVYYSLYIDAYWVFKWDFTYDS
jgi:hypothetical protein